MKIPLSQAPTANTPNSESDSSAPSLAYGWYVVGMLMVCYLFSVMDRFVMTLLVAPIKQDLALSDTQVSLLIGFAFTLFYVLMGLPIGRLVDRSHRIRIIAVGVAVWSVMTAACGLAKNFLHLFVARFGVGAGEAALSPGAYSLISDYFPPRLLSRAISTYAMGAVIGGGGAFVVGGMVVKMVRDMSAMDLPFIGQVMPWQLVFFIVGLPGLLLALWLLTIHEPLRRSPTGQGRQTLPAVAVSEVWHFVVRHKRTFLSHFLGLSSMTLFATATAIWLPTVFFRTYGMNIGEVGIRYGLIIMVAGPIGLFLAGWGADRLRQRGRIDADFLVLKWTAFLALVPQICFALMPTANLAWLLVVPLVMATSAPWGVGFSAVTRMTPNAMRGQMTALCLFVINILGAASGPTIVALCTDYLFQDEQAVRYSIALVGGTFALLAGVLFAWGRRFYKESVDVAQA